MWLLIKAFNFRKVSLKGLEADLDKSFVTLDILIRISVKILKT